ncbi:alpha/beta fold hydrolase [Duganella callida]|uniref:Alpha/beta hydrolase n=1 Tax=Duganella callida TaxID=2561932 RepID=A0A4Y9S9Y6_9BURK|nr:alpha/beta hydrolase [Duganella callida]TFW18643.1 alpha/beta hydrolase [Duganella callida]
MSGDGVSVVLVHGAWADGSSWSKVISALSAKGIAVAAPQLPLMSLSNDVDVVEQVIERAKGPVVLVGHAYGGAVIGACTSSKVSALVYVAALAPDLGEKVTDVFYRSPPHPMSPQLAPDIHGLIWLPDGAFARAFAQNASDDELAVLAAVQRPIAPACITSPVDSPLWKKVPSWFLIAEEDRMIPFETQRFMSERMQAQVWSRSVDHTPAVTEPDVVTDIIFEAIKAVKR